MENPEFIEFELNKLFTQLPACQIYNTRHEIRRHFCGTYDHAPTQILIEIGEYFRNRGMEYNCIVYTIRRPRLWRDAVAEDFMGTKSVGKRLTGARRAQ